MSGLAGHGVSGRATMRGSLLAAGIATLAAALAIAVTPAVAWSTATRTEGVGNREASVTEGQSGRVQGRLTVDGRPVEGEQVTLAPFPSDPNDSEGDETITDDKGRFSFKSVTPGRYKLYTGLAFKDDGKDRTCKWPGFRALTIQATNAEGDTIAIASLESKKALRVDTEKRITRNVQVKCKPHAVLVKSEPPAPRDSTEEAFLDDLEVEGLRDTYGSDDEAVSAGRQACDDFRAEKEGTGQVDPFNFDFNLLLVAVPHFCPDLGQFITEVPAGGE